VDLSETVYILLTIVHSPDRNTLFISRIIRYMAGIRFINPFLWVLCCAGVLYSGGRGMETGKESPVQMKNVQLPKPEILPVKDVFTASIEVSLSLPCEDTCCDGAAIFYTTDGSDPKVSSTAMEYFRPFRVSRTMTVKAYAQSPQGCKDESKRSEKRYTLLQPLPLPTVAPRRGRVVFGEKIRISITGFEKDTTVKVFYTLDGSDPSIAGTTYNGPFQLHKSAILRVIAVSTTGAYLNSPILYRKYTCYLALSSSPTFHPPSTNFFDNIEVSLSAPESESEEELTIFYTLDGSVPTIFSDMYLKPLKISETVELKAISLRKGYRPSKVVSELYVKGEQPVVPKPVVNPGGGVYGGGIPPITFSHNLEKSMIMYTLDGSEPTMASNLWEGKQLLLTAPVTLKVKAFKTDWNPSVTVTEKYEYEQLPEPFANFPSGTVFTDTLAVTLRVPGFRNEPGLKIYYTLDGSDPLEYSQRYENGSFIIIHHSCILKTFAKNTGYYDSKISTYEYFNMIQVTHAYYQDNDRDRKIESAVLLFNKPLTGPPSLIEFTDPYTFKKRKVLNNTLVTAGPDKNKRVEVTFSKPFGPGGNFPSGHYGRIPLPGEFDTAPFLIHDSTSSHDVFPLTRKDIEKLFITSLQYDNQDVAVLNNPFEPGTSKLPTIIQELNEFRTETGTAILVKPLHPSEGSAEIYDMLGNVLLLRKQLIEDPATGILFCVWDGKNSENHFVEEGTYLVILTTREKQSRESTVRKINIVVNR